MPRLRGAGSGSPSVLHIRLEVQGWERPAEAPGCPPSPPGLPALVPVSCEVSMGENRAWRPRPSGQLLSQPHSGWPVTLSPEDERASVLVAQRERCRASPLRTCLRAGPGHEPDPQRPRSGGPRAPLPSSLARMRPRWQVAQAADALGTPKDAPDYRPAPLPSR